MLCFYFFSHSAGKLSNMLGVYEGEFEKDAKKGRGLMLYADGSKYEGYWTNNQRHDKGYFECKSGAFVRYGVSSCGQENCLVVVCLFVCLFFFLGFGFGFGVGIGFRIGWFGFLFFVFCYWIWIWFWSRFVWFIYLFICLLVCFFCSWPFSIASYDGDWVLGLKSGKGRMTFADGSFYDGNFVDDLVCFLF
jgi:hypothetical protein